MKSALNQLYQHALVKVQVGASCFSDCCTITSTVSHIVSTGVNQFAQWYNAKINLERGFLEENIMDDVGEENLRFFKEHLQPKRMLKKYIVTYK